MLCLRSGRQPHDADARDGRRAADASRLPAHAAVGLLTGRPWRAGDVAVLQAGLPDHQPPAGEARTR